ncbi:MAG: phytoene desaturase family protein [Alphaproteobacteria bacterium]|nr:phytoene desaturase family protein [Alphaproteobacteria bacterium]
MRVVVIGSGFGGLASAIRLAARGHQVHLLEACDQIGGRAQTVQLGSVACDMGPTVITAPYLFAELFALAGERLEEAVTIQPLKQPWYRFQFAGGDSYDYGAANEFEQTIRQHFPGDLEGYRALRAHAAKLYTTGYEQLAGTSFDRIGVMLRHLPDIIRLGGYRSVDGLVRRYIRSDRLAQMLSTAPLLLGGNPKTASSLYFLIHELEQRHGVHYVKGGTMALVRALGALAARLGVVVETGRHVTGFRMNKERIHEVICQSGQHYPADSVIFGGDAATLYRKLIPPMHQSPLTRLRAHYHAPSMGLMVVYFTTRRRYDMLAHHTIGFSASYTGVLQDIFSSTRLPQDFSFYLHRPAASDPEACPPDTDLYYVLVPVPALVRHETSEEDYQLYRDHILRVLEERLMPGLRSQLLHVSHVSPRYFRDTLKSHAGAGFSLQPTLTQSAWFRFHNRDPRIANLYLCGAGTHPGAGLPGVLHSAKIVESLVE